MAESKYSEIKENEKLFNKWTRMGIIPTTYVCNRQICDYYLELRKKHDSKMLCYQFTADKFKKNIDWVRKVIKDMI